MERMEDISDSTTQNSKPPLHLEAVDDASNAGKDTQNRIAKYLRGNGLRAILYVAELDHSAAVNDFSETAEAKMERILRREADTYI